MNGPSTGGEVNFIWATRGKTWGFRFLRSGGLQDPLSVYEATFAELGDGPEAWRKFDGRVALRFPDPDGRQDAASRVIPHDFVLLGRWADEISSLEEGRAHVWPEVATEFESVWDKPEPPTPM